jgi:E3 ubiquitin-protein ligase DOA10
LEVQVESLRAERDKYRDHRDDLADIVSNKVINVMEQHMNDTNISESSIQSNNDHSQDGFDLPAVQTRNED